ncbi:MAG: YfcC family protein [Clostridia bacterium]|nr:YfcC family protein [Clostridia bacterium]
MSNKTLQKNEKKGLNVSVKSFAGAIAVILALMIFTYALTFFIPGGEYARTLDAAGNTIIDAEGGFSYIDGGLPLWKWLLSPVLVLGAEGGGMMIAIIVFLFVIGGVFNSLDADGLMKYMLDKIVYHFGGARYKLMAVVMFFFMAMGAFIGSFEECIPLVPIVVSLSVSLGWDVMTGMAMSLLAVGCGFASGVCNPFTVGVAQSLAGLPMFSGIWLRLVSFVVIYALLFVFTFKHGKKVSVNTSAEISKIPFTPDKKMDKGLICFASIVGFGMLLVLSSGFITALQDYTMVIVAVMFLIAGITSVLVSGMKGKDLGKYFGKGVVGILPAVLMLLMASSIKYILTEAKILDTILYWAVDTANGMPKWMIILFVYLIVLVMNFFISSGSAKAFLLIPLIVPMAQLFGIEAQLCIMAFAFGDGFSNVFYPTNAALLIALGLTDVSYGKWIKFSWKFQALNLLVTSGLLLLGLAIGYK